MLPSNDPEMYRRMSGGAPFASTGGGGFGGGYDGGGINPNNMYGGGSQSGFLDFYNRNRGGGGFGRNPMISDQLYRGPYDGGFGGGFGRRPSNPYGGGFGGGFGGGYMAPLPSPYRNPYYMDSLRGGGMGQVMPTNIPYRDPGYGSPMRTQNLIQSLGGPQTSFRDPNRKYNTMRMLENFRGGNMGSPYPMPYPMPSPGGKGGRMPMPGMPGKGGRMPGMPGKGGQMPPDQGMPPAGGEVPPAGTPPAGTPPAGEAPPAGGTPPADTTPANNLTDAQTNILAEQGFTEQEARDAFNAIIQDQAGTLDPRFADLIGTGYYRRIGEAFGLKDAAGNPVTLGGTTTVAGGRQNTPTEEKLAEMLQNIPQAGVPEESPPADAAPPADQPPAGESAPPPADAGSDVVAGGNPYYDSLTPEQRAAIDQIRQGGFSPFGTAQGLPGASLSPRDSNMMTYNLDPNRGVVTDYGYANSPNPFLGGIGSLYGVGGGTIPNLSGIRF